VQDTWLQHHAKQAARQIEQATKPPPSAVSDGKKAPTALAKPLTSTPTSPLALKLSKHGGGEKGQAASPPKIPRPESATSLASQGSKKTRQSRPALTRADSSFSQASRASTPSRPARTASGTGLPPLTPRQAATPTAAGDNSFLAAKITEERIDAQGKKHVITKFVMPSRTSSGPAPSLPPQMQSTRTRSGPAPAMKQSSSLSALHRSATADFPLAGVPPDLLLTSPALFTSAHHKRRTHPT
jgi:hypothetical protein